MSFSSAWMTNGTVLTVHTVSGSGSRKHEVEKKDNKMHQHVVKFKAVDLPEEFVVNLYIY